MTRIFVERDRDMRARIERTVEELSDLLDHLDDDADAEPETDEPRRVPAGSWRWGA